MRAITVVSQWTLPSILIAALLAPGCAPEPVESPPEELDLTAVKADGTTLRSVSLVLQAGQSKRYRVRATGFHAQLTAAQPVMAQLTAMHYEHRFEGEVSLAPTVDASADETIRNWTLRVDNHGSQTLQGELEVTTLAQQGAPELGIISDIDKTVLPPEKSDGSLPPPYPGMATLLTVLELGQADAPLQPGDLTYVTARTMDGVAGIPAWMELHHVPLGPIETGISGMPWVAQPEKVKDISAVLDANPEQRYVMFGDSSHRDPEVYREIIDAYGDRVVAALIHLVNNPNPDRLQGLYPVHNYAEAAAVLLKLRVLSTPAARQVMQAAQDEGLAISDSEIETLLSDNQPDPQTPTDPPTTDPPTEPPPQPYHGNTSSKSFHAPGCPYYECSSCTATFATREEAIAAGYHPCGVCKP